MTTLPKIPDGDAIIWKAYGQLVKNLLLSGNPLGQNDRVYLCPPTQMGIAAGDWIPKPVTNEQVHAIADTLLPTDSPLFVGGENGSYVDSLEDYLSWVALKSNPDAGALIRLENARQVLATRQAAERTLKKTAIDFFNTDTTKDPNATFLQWCRENAQDYLQAVEEVKNAGEAFRQAYQDVYGSDAALILEKQENIKLAKEPTDQDGFNMRCTMQDLDNIQKQFKTGTPNPVPTGFTRPSYSLQGLTAAVNNWVSTFKTTTAQTFTLDIASAKTTSWSDLGHEHVESDSGNNFWIIFNSTTHHDSTTDTRSVAFTDVSSEVEVRLTISHQQVFKLDSGLWNVPDVAHQFPNLRDGAPANLVPKMVKAGSVLLGYGVGLQATFKGQAREQFDTMFNNVTNDSNSGLTIFGIHFGSSSSSSSTRHIETSEMQSMWNAGTLSIPPVDNGYPVLLGVLGKKLNTA